MLEIFQGFMAVPMLPLDAAAAAALPFYARLGYSDDPCPQPEYPFFEIDFTTNR